LEARPDLRSVDRSSARTRKGDLTPEGFERLLDWLDQNRDAAGHRYEEIRTRLIKVFVCRGCSVPEELADETINRVAGKIDQIATTYVGNPVLYFYGVADKIFLEYVRKRSTPSLPLPESSTEEAEQRYRCLEQCMERLSAQSRELILAYYGSDMGTNIDTRKELAERTGIGANALWIRAHRIRESLRQCVRECLRRHARTDLFGNAKPDKYSKEN
jgi:RNA polymerase sigma factor (sigma-70 family)